MTEKQWRSQDSSLEASSSEEALLARCSDTATATECTAVAAVWMTEDKTLVVETVVEDSWEEEQILSESKGCWPSRSYRRLANF